LLACTWKVTNKVLGRSHDKIRKWVKTKYMPESTHHREAILPQETKGGEDN
jgi:hypothetical protein